MAGDQLVPPVAPGPPAGLRVPGGSRRAVQSGHLAAPSEKTQGHGITVPAGVAATARSRLRSCPEREAFRRYAWPMALREEPVAPRIGGPDRRRMLQAAGFMLAIAATLAV